MNVASEAQKITLPSPLPDSDRMVKALGSPVRWKMLQELSKGEPRTIGELASAAGCNYDNAGRHLIVLRKAGLVMQGRGRLYQIPKQYLSANGQPHVDYGHCLLRMDAENQN
jgi:DNA-binding transcriptional ArsR family regulator